MYSSVCVVFTRHEIKKWSKSKCNKTLQFHASPKNRKENICTVMRLADWRLGKILAIEIDCNF